MRGKQYQNKKKASYLYRAWTSVKAAVVNLHVNVLNVCGQWWAEYINTIKVGSFVGTAETTLLWIHAFLSRLLFLCSLWTLWPLSCDTQSFWNRKWARGCSTYMSSRTPALRSLCMWRHHRKLSFITYLNLFDKVDSGTKDQHPV